MDTGLHGAKLAPVIPIRKLPFVFLSAAIGTGIFMSVMSDKLNDMAEWKFYLILAVSWGTGGLIAHYSIKLLTYPFMQNGKSDKPGFYEKIKTRHDDSNLT